MKSPLRGVVVAALVFAVVAAGTPAGSTALRARAAGTPAAQCISASVSFVAVPAGFRPETASDAQLQCYGFPPRPADPTALANWTTAMRAFKEMVGPPVWVAEAAPQSIAPDGVVGTQSNVWAGYAAQTTHNPSISSFFKVSADWTVPNVNGTKAPEGLLAWVGLGGMNSPAYLVQAGTVSQVASPQYQAWWEDYNSNENNPIIETCPGQYCVNFRPGDTAYAYVYDLGNHTAFLYWEDVTTGQGMNDMNASTPYVDDSSAEAVTEWDYSLPATTYYSYWWSFKAVQFTNVTTVVLPGSASYQLGNLNVTKEDHGDWECPTLPNPNYTVNSYYPSGGCS